MWVFLFISRLSLVAALIAYQVYLAYIYGLDIGIRDALTYQCALQIAVAVVAPASCRALTALVAAWASVALFFGLLLTWTTVVIPIVGAIAYFLHGDGTILMYLIGLTAYLAVPVGIFYAAAAADEGM